ncbi:MAG: CoA-binding protein [Microscillaceae bacterium]|nr:CoA-binding protein [Microscillaceae bacterium]
MDLIAHQHEIVLLGVREGAIAGHPILAGQPEVRDVHTVSLYIKPLHQPAWYDYLLALQPQRIIFNPGTENPELAQKAARQGIEVRYACTLVMLAQGQY